MIPAEVINAVARTQAARPFGERTALRNSCGSEGGAPRNRAKDAASVEVACGQKDESALPQTFVDYEEHPR